MDIVHGHSAFSSLAHEALFVGSLMGLGTIFTDHSLFGFADASAIVTNTFLKFSLVNTRYTPSIHDRQQQFIRNEFLNSLLSAIASV